MSKKELFHKIDSALINIYIEKDNNLFSVDIDEDYKGQKKKYGRLYKKLLFKASSTIKEQKIARIISLPKASMLLDKLNESYTGRVFPLFKKYIEQEGLVVNYRNFDNMTEEEMVNILEQVSFTKLLDKIDEELKND